jgi:hypothetical protein
MTVMWTASRADIEAGLWAISAARSLRFSDGNHFVDDVQSYLERGSDGLSLINGRIPMENLLQHFSVGDKTLPRCNQAFQDDLRLCLVRMCGINPGTPARFR